MQYYTKINSLRTPPVGYTTLFSKNIWGFNYTNGSFAAVKLTCRKELLTITDKFLSQNNISLFEALIDFKKIKNIRKSDIIAITLASENCLCLKNIAAINSGYTMDKLVRLELASSQFLALDTITWDWFLARSLDSTKPLSYLYIWLARNDDLDLATIDFEKNNLFPDKIIPEQIASMTLIAPDEPPNKALLILKIKFKDNKLIMEMSLLADKTINTRTCFMLIEKEKEKNKIDTEQLEWINQQLTLTINYFINEDSDLGIGKIYILAKDDIKKDIENIAKNKFKIEVCKKVKEQNIGIGLEKELQISLGTALSAAGKGPQLVNLVKNRKQKNKKIANYTIIFLLLILVFLNIIEAYQIIKKQEVEEIISENKQKNEEYYEVIQKNIDQIQKNNSKIQNYLDKLDLFKIHSMTVGEITEKIFATFKQLNMVIKNYEEFYLQKVKVDRAFEAEEKNIEEYYYRVQIEGYIITQNKNIPLKQLDLLTDKFIKQKNTLKDSLKIELNEPEINDNKNNKNMTYKTSWQAKYIWNNNDKK